jgi:glycosyltransferase involved in cell wall biosynthesis
MPSDLVILNGRAGARPTVSGVERWTREVARLLLARQPKRYVEVAPPRRLSGKLGQPWEQLALPLQAAARRAEFILSPANLAPLAWPRNVVTVHDAAILRTPDAYSPAYRRWHAWVGAPAIRRAVHVLTVSEFSRSELVELMGLEPDRVTVVGGGVSDSFSEEADAASVRARYRLERPYVLAVGTADRRKNLSVLPLTAQRLAMSGRELVWAGGARSHIQGSTLGPEVRALGYVPEADLPGLYAGAEAFVLPSLYEGFGLPCLEAMASSTPVVASNRGALPEVCAGAALLVDPHDEHAVADAVVRVLDDRELSANLQRRGRQRAAEFSWDAVAGRVDQVLEGLAQ